jgi:hypothetical protein
VRYGTARWGEKYAEAARVTGYDVASLRNMAWVASRASEERLSVADLRLELRALRDGGGKPSGGATAAKDGDDLAVCPHCGHSLSSP